MSLGACRGDQSFWIDWNKSLWIGAYGKEGACGSVLVTVRERRVSSMEAAVSSRMEKERVFRWVKREL